MKPWAVARSVVWLVFAALVGCNVAGTVIDVSGTETWVSDMRVSGDGTLKIITGNAIQRVPLEAFESILLFPNETRTIDGDFCFLAEIVMRDGTRLAARDKPHDNAPRTFISVNQTLTGTCQRGSFSADLATISKITFR